MATFFHLDGMAQALKLPGYTLLLPTLSIGGVGQLAADLLVNTLEMKKLGYLEDPNVLPFLGNGALGDAGNITTSVEVFADDALKLAVIQQRSPVVKNRNKHFALNVAELAKAGGVRQVLLLSSVDSARRVDDGQYSASSAILCRYLASAEVDTKPLARTEEWKQFEKGSFEVLVKERSFTRYFLSACESHCVPTLVLAVFCGTGVTIPYGMKMADGVASYLRMFEEGPSWKAPPSWCKLMEESGVISIPTPDYLM